ncbi:MAG: helix-turn-helix domain-containing protein [Anaerolineae bacterium]|nr:helix-turn-helix domain-containing protein [Anaerolineae bacterium]
MQLYVDGMSLRRIARHLGLHHHTVSPWIQAQAE